MSPFLLISLILGAATATNPTVSISTCTHLSYTVDVNADGVVDNNDAICSVSFTFSSEPVGFSESDILVTNGILSGFNGSGTSFSVTFTLNSGATGYATIQISNNVGVGDSFTITILNASPPPAPDLAD